MRLLFTIILFLGTSLHALSFGQNKVQYREFDWQFIQTPHFDIYYYGGEQDLAEFTADVAEESYEQISLHLRWDLKRRVSIMVYNSHNEFQQTNVVGTYMREGIGGVTELFKNRVVFPFEGNYEQFRHVIHHELVHALINDMVYGGSMQHVISSRTKIRVPIWSNEGLAEYLSSNWDTKADMVMRDIAIHERMPSVKELNYFMAYKGGQSLWRFIAGKYGREKVGDIFRSMKQTQNAEKGYEKALGMNYKDLTIQWHKYLKKEYWSDVKDRDPLEDMSEKLTDHKKARNFYNVSPALSPDGSMVAVLSDQTGYFDIHIMDAMTGKRIKKLVKGNRSVDFEELKWLQPGLSWSPDSKKIVVAAKAGKGDVLHIIDVKTRKGQKIELDLDGVFSAAWSPLGNEIAFVGQMGNSSDIYIYDLNDRSKNRITNDIFTDSYPSWNSEGTEIVFVSDRGEYIDGEYDGTMFEHNYRQTDIFTVNVKSGKIDRITETDYNESHPIWANTKNTLFYTADKNGVWNLFIHPFQTEYDPESGEHVDAGGPYAVTNVLTGLQQPTLSGNDDMLIFAGYAGIGWDLYSLPNPLNLSKKEIEPTQYEIHRKTDDEKIADLRRHKTSQQEQGFSEGYSGWIFARGYEHFNSTMEEKPSEELVSVDSAKVDGHYIPKSYKTRFTLDIISGNLQISNVFGTSGMTYFSFSDILGDHQIAFGTEMVLTLENSDYFFYYAYLKNRIDYHFVAFQNADFFNVDYYSIGRLRHYGLQGFISHPFSRFQRFDYGLSWHNINYAILEQRVDEFNQIHYVTTYSSKYSTILPMVSWVYDNSVFGFTGPIDGFRQNMSFTMSPGYGSDNLKFQTLKMDMRKYWRVGKDYTFAVRGYLGKSMGANKQNFFLGGIPYLLGGRGETNGKADKSHFRSVILDTSNASLIHDIYFTEYAFPLRGARFAERFGYNTALFNLEIRFPFINYLALGFPLKVIFGNIRGHAFMDIGAAWDDPKEFTTTSWPDRYGSSNSGEFSPWVTTVGLGTKINLGYFLLRIETAWDKNPNKYSKPQWYFSLGPDW
jgi:Tol biopolymer transport system component